MKHVSIETVLKYHTRPGEWIARSGFEPDDGGLRRLKRDNRRQPSDSPNKMMSKNIDPGVFEGRTVLVTGGTGFIGSHLVRRLVVYEADVIVIEDFSTGPRSNIEDVEDEIRLIESDIANISRPLPGFSDVECVFHLAAVPSVSRSVSDPATTHRANLTGTLRLLEIAREIDPRMVVVAGSTIKGAGVAKTDRNQSFERPSSIYSASKGAMELYAGAYFERFGVPVIVLRLSHVFGPGQHRGEDGYTTVMSSMITRVQEGRPPELSKSEQNGHDYIYVDDVVDAFLLAGEATDHAGDVYDVCTGSFVSDRELLEHLKQLTDDAVPEPVQVEREDDYVERDDREPEQAEEELGFTPDTSFQEGLAMTFKWFQEQR